MHITCCVVSLDWILLRRGEAAAISCALSKQDSGVKFYVYSNIRLVWVKPGQYLKLRLLDFFVSIYISQSQMEAGWEYEEFQKRQETPRLHVLENSWIFDEPYSHHCTIFKVVKFLRQPQTPARHRRIFNARFWIMREYLGRCQSAHMLSLWKVNHPQLLLVSTFFFFF